MLAARDWYRDACTNKDDKDDSNLHGDLLLQFIRMQTLALTPVTPHASEYIWSEVLKEPTSVQHARFPEPTKPVDTVVLQSAEYVRETVKSIRDAEIALEKRKAKGKTLTYEPRQPKALVVFAARDYPEWQTSCIEVMKQVYNKETKTMDRGALKKGVDAAGLMKCVFCPPGLLPPCSEANRALLSSTETKRLCRSASPSRWEDLLVLFAAQVVDAIPGTFTECDRPAWRRCCFRETHSLQRDGSPQRCSELFQENARLHRD